MRVIIKPAGLVLLAGAIGTLVLLVVAARIKAANDAALGAASLPGVALPPAASRAPVADTAAGEPVALNNPGFEGGYAAVTTPPTPDWKQGARRSGLIAAGWADNSRWTDAAVVYAPDTAYPHGGQQSQRIEVGGYTYGRVHFGQPVKLEKGREYRASVWVRASREGVPVEFGIRQMVKPYNYYRYKVAGVGTGWQRLEVAALVSGAEYAVVNVSVSKPGVTVWVDDAAFEKVR